MPKRCLRLRKSLVDKVYDDGAFADGGSHALDVPDRASPTTNTPGRLVSSICGRRDKAKELGVGRLQSRPVRTNPLLSSDGIPPANPFLAMPRSSQRHAVLARWCLGSILVDP